VNARSDRPLVALTTSFDPEAGSHHRPQVVLYEAYIKALEDAGLATVLVSPAHSTASVAALLGHCDGLVLSGGGDVDPAHYGEKPGPELDSVSAERDAAEFAALDAAVERQLPIFGICRGIQVMNVYLGGSLHQHVDSERSGVSHQQKAPWSAHAHDVTVDPGSRLCAIVGASAIRTNSFHHQAIKQVAPSLTVSARAPDGLVEAVEMQNYPWGLGVQWHPERQDANAPPTDPDRRLFAAFAEAVARYRDHVHVTEPR
jgi:putative glutamine amidotransferase